MKKNIFIVRSPLQVINAIEAKEHFKLKNTVLLMIFNGGDINTTQMKKVMRFTSWDEVLIYEKSQKGSSFIQQVKLIKKLQQEKYEYLFSGDFGTINKMIMANLEVDKHFLIDDGTATIIIHEKLSGKKKIPFSKKMKLVRYQLVGLKSDIVQTINFFTCYNLEQIKDESVVKNNYTYLQNKYLNTLTKDESTYLLGQNLTQVGCMKDDVYVSYLRQVIEHYEGKVVYIPHRSEIISNKLKLLQNDKFIIQENHGPIELSFLTQGIYPFRVISFVSSALFTLNKIFSQTIIHAVKLEEKDLISHHQAIRSCYDFFDETNIKTITFNK